MSRKKKTTKKTTKADASRSLEPVLLELHMPYYKVGDDFRALLEEFGGDVTKAMRRWSSRLRDAAMALDRVALSLEDLEGVRGDGDAHSATVSGVPRGCAEYLEEVTGGVVAVASGDRT